MWDRFMRSRVPARDGSAAPGASVRPPIYAFLASLLVLLAAHPAAAQLRPSLTFGHETWPSVAVSNMEVDAASSPSMRDLSVWTDTRFVRASYPMVVHGGRTYLDLQAGFQRIQYRYDGWTATLPRPTDAYIIDLTVLAQRSLAPRWSLLAQANPALKSGLEDPLIREDFAVEGALLFSRQTGERSVLGVGIAYSTNFGAPLPIPLLQLERTGTFGGDGPAWRAGALLPSTLAAWIVPTQRLEAGLQVRTLGDRHHLTENAALDGANLRTPYSDYFDTVAGPTLIAYLTPWLTVNVESGLSLYRQVQVTDGRDEVVSFEPDRSIFLRWHVTIGGSSPLAGG